MSTKKLRIEIYGEGTVYRSRQLNVEVPADSIEADIEGIMSDEFDFVETLPSWEDVEYVGTSGREDLGVRVVDELDANDPVSARIVRDAEDDLVIATK